MTCTERTSRTIMTAVVLAALLAATAPAATAAVRSADQTAAAAPDGGWRALFGPWHAIETWLRNLTAADGGEGGEGEGEGEGEGGSAQEPPPPPTCPPRHTGGPCNDPDG